MHGKRNIYRSTLLRVDVYLSGLGNRFMTTSVNLPVILQQLTNNPKQLYKYTYIPYPS